MKKKITQKILHNYIDTYSIDYAINDRYIVQYDSETNTVSVPSSNEQFFSNREEQDQACQSVDIDQLLAEVQLDTSRDQDFDIVF
jgi:type I site-specific restriction-modification system R (restriction) subunit